MGNTAGKLTPCLCAATGTGGGDISRRYDISVAYNNNPYDDGLGHSFCYIRPDQFGLITKSSSSTSSSNSISALQTTPVFRTISGASISANTSTPLSTTLFLDPYPYPYPPTMDRASSFESSPSFASVPLQPIPRNQFVNSGPIPGSGSMLGSGPIERGFLSGPIERGFTSGPIDHRTIQEGRNKAKYKFNKWGSIKGIKDSVLGAIWGSGSGKGYDSVKETEWKINNNNNNELSVGKSSVISGDLSFSGRVSGSLLCEDQQDDGQNNNNNLQWAQGKAGEDRVNIVISEDHGWVFVGIYDGFNGPDAPDFLLSNLYSAVHKELKGLLQVWNDRLELELESVAGSNQSTVSKDSSVGNSQVDEEVNSVRRVSGMDCDCSRSVSWCVDQEFENGDNSSIDSDTLKKKKGMRNVSNGNGNRNNSKVTWDNSNGNILELDERIREKIHQMGSNLSNKVRHNEVLKALSEALRKTEEAYLDIADKMVKDNPELCLMGSCVLVMLMMGDDVYLMNVGDSRAVLGQKVADPDFFNDLPDVSSLQLTVDHNTYVKEEVKRIRNEHPDDPSAVVNHRVKGSLKVTRAFGAGFLKQRKWNEALLETFRIDYVGNSPYLTCRPSLYHHKVGPKDKFLILSSDGLYQYFTNEEAISEVELFMVSTPEGDPAQHLIEEVLFRAAKRAGIDFHELLEIPQGERRRYHDDVSVIVISLEGRICWRSSM